MKQMKNIFLLCITICVITSCQLFMHQETKEKAKATGVAFKKTKTTIANGESEYLLYTVTPTTIQNEVSATWAYDDTIISIDPDRYGVVVTGKKSGQTYLKITINNITATCIITVTGNPDIYEGEPYIYSNFTVVELTPGSNTTVTASLYGGSSTDLENMVWTIKDPTIANIDFARGSCVITAKKTGSTQLTVTNSKSEYPYSLIVYVYNDELNEPYITTNQNVMIINKTESKTRNISVEIKNPYATTNQFDFSYEVITNDNKPHAFSVTGNGNTAILTAENNGLSLLRITHPDCKYPLDILVKVTTTVENVYVVPSCTTLEVIGSNTAHNIYASVTGAKVHADPGKFIWTVLDENEAQKYAEWEIIENCFSVMGKKNGAFKVKVSHELSEYARTILVVLREQAGSAIDASMYITTTSNFVQTQVGAETTMVSVTLKGGLPGDEHNLIWTIENGENNDICKIITPTGTVSSRSINSGNVTNGNLYITPLKKGKTKVTVSHPKVLYETEIIINVLSEFALLSQPLYITANPIIKMLNGSTQEITSEITGNVNTGDENGVLWTSANEAVITVSPKYGLQTICSANGTGNNQTYLSITHEKALAEKKVLILSANTQEDLDTMKGIYANETYIRINENTTKKVSLEEYGLTENDIRNIKWTTNDSTICTVSAENNNFLNATVSGIKAGKTTITATLTDCEPCVFDITILPDGEETEVIEPKYLTTFKNAIVIPKVGDSASLSVSGINISSADMTIHTQWESLDSDIATVTFNAGDATIIAIKEGKTRIHITNTYADNDLYIDVKVGALYEWEDDFVVYITTEEDTVTMTKGDTKTIGAALENATTQNGFSWEVTEGKELLEITGSASGICVLSAKEAGIAEITIRNNTALFEKQILVVISNTKEELQGIQYLTTKQNVVTVGETYNTTVMVSIVNATQNIIDGYYWSSSDTSIIQVVESGATAVLYGRKQGTAKITVTNNYCDYPLEIIVNCVDPVLAAANPYITSQNIITVHVGDDVKTITADLVGGTEADYKNFSWHIQDNSIATLYASNETAQIKAVSEGVTQIVVSHPKAGGIDRTILVICEPKIQNDCYITVTESIIKMSPTDSPKTITATLINGTANDNYNFKWWADNYDIIDINYTSESAVITPIGTGNVTLHVSHPKAPTTKDIILYISQFSEFAFENTAKTITAGKQTFVNMQVPVTSMATKVSYSVKNMDGSAATDIVSASGTNDVCIINAHKKGSCIVVADLIAINTGIKQASCQLLVNVEDAPVSSTYIHYTGSTILNIEKGATMKLNATLAGVNATAGSKVQWKSSDQNIIRLSSASQSGVFTGNEVQINALQAGKECTITISHNDADFDVILYCIIPGENVANILLDRSAMYLIQGDSSQFITASITNAQEKDYENLIWDIEQNENNPVIHISGSGKKIAVLPENVGTAKITATVPSSARTASCTIVVEEPRVIKLNQDVISVYPGEEFKIKYTVKPENEKGTVQWTTDNNAFFAIANDDKNGTLTCIAKNKEGTANLTGTTQSKATASCVVINSWGNMLTIDKSFIKTIPVNNNDGTFDVAYQLKPACAEVQILISQPNLSVTNADGTGANKFTIKADKHTVNTETGIASGLIKFNPTGESNGTVIIQAYNPVSINGNAPIGLIQDATKEIEINASYNKLNFYFKNITMTNGGKYSRYNTLSDILIIGDGEKITVDIGTLEINASPNITSVKFSKDPKNIIPTTIWNDNPNMFLETWCVPVSNSKSKYNIQISKDFCKANGYYNKTGTDIDTQYNTTVVKLLYIGNLEIHYTSTFNNQKLQYNIPVYLEIRNCEKTYQ